MFKSIRAARDQVEAQASSCALRRNAYRVCKSETSSRVRDELSRPGTLVGVFALGAMLGGRKGGRRSASAQLSELERSKADVKASLEANLEANLEEKREDLKDMLSDVQAEIEALLGHIAPQGEMQSGESRTQGTREFDLAETASALAMSIVTRFTASLALEKLGDIRSKPGDASGADAGEAASEFA